MASTAKIHIESSTGSGKSICGQKRQQILLTEDPDESNCGTCHRIWKQRIEEEPLMPRRRYHGPAPVPQTVPPPPPRETPYGTEYHL
jgi:hypothetical protein